ncbi:hypothetical protein CWI37_1161p0010 [Hamiltosporidium tvaerminnensis]|uniref:C3H1-type domain-containing protein n=1 Tax=Hamiltosporidium tvaerminnensis TaxID=1176355 RepID=A0A4Q9L0B3_9MICR|nr:hypothetical protein CWI37_1161p0010 [Hamiltosporidium tvaerminnensis]
MAGHNSDINKVLSNIELQERYSNSNETYNSKDSININKELVIKELPNKERINIRSNYIMNKDMIDGKNIINSKVLNEQSKVGGLPNTLFEVKNNFEVKKFIKDANTNNLYESNRNYNLSDVNNKCDNKSESDIYRIINNFTMEYNKSKEDKVLIRNFIKNNKFEEIINTQDLENNSFTNIYEKDLLNILKSKYEINCTNIEGISDSYFIKKRINLYKTEMCRSFEETGFCKYSERCQFAHSKSELRSIQRHPRYKTETCRTFWEEGTCPYGKRCCFIHMENKSLNKKSESDIKEADTENCDSNTDKDYKEKESNIPDTISNVHKINSEYNIEATESILSSLERNHESISKFCLSKKNEGIKDDKFVAIDNSVSSNSTEIQNSLENQIESFETFGIDINDNEIPDTFLNEIEIKNIKDNSISFGKTQNNNTSSESLDKNESIETSDNQYNETKLSSNIDLQNIKPFHFTNDADIWLNGIPSLCFIKTRNRRYHGVSLQPKAPGEPVMPICDEEVAEFVLKHLKL